MAEVINNVDLTSQSGGGATINNQDISVTENGVYTADEGYTGFGEVEVNVPAGDNPLKTAKLFNIVSLYSSLAIDENGIASGIDSYNYFLFPFPVANADWELVLCAACNNGSNVNCLCAVNHGGYWVCDWVLCINDSGNPNKTTFGANLNGWVNTPGNETISIGTGTYYYYKFVYDKTAGLTLYISTDGENYTKDLEVLQTHDYSGILTIGQNSPAASESWYGGTIDFSKSYLKINNETYNFI